MEAGGRAAGQFLLTACYTRVFVSGRCMTSPPHKPTVSTSNNVMTRNS